MDGYNKARRMEETASPASSVQLRLRLTLEPATALQQNSFADGAQSSFLRLDVAAHSSKHATNIKVAQASGGDVERTQHRASAMGFVLLLILLFLTVVQLRWLRSSVEY